MATATLLATVQGGGYINLFKILPVVALLLLWARLLTWADKDAPYAHLPREILNSGFLVGLAFAFALFFLLPNFWLAFTALFFCFAAEVGTYLGLRQQKVGLGDLKQQFKDWRAGLKSDRVVELEPGKIQFIGASGGAIAPPPADSTQRAGYDAAQNLLTDPLLKGAEQIEAAPEENAMQVKYVVDGVGYRGAAIDRTDGSNAITYIKGLAGLNVDEKRKPQSGMLRVAVDEARHELRVQTAGARAGEALRATVDPKKRHTLTLDSLGLTDRQHEMLLETIHANEGIVLVSAPKGHGLTSMLYGVLKSHDAFLQHIQTIERDLEQDLEGITQNRLAPSATGEEEAKLASWMVSQEPDIIMISRIEDRRTAMELIGFAKTGKRVYVGMRAGTAIDALDQWRKLVGDSAAALEPVRLAIAGRVLRRLCVACKIGYVPDPATLRKLNITLDAGATLFQARTRPMQDAKGNVIPCEFCKDLYFKSRSGIFEILVVDDDVRQAVNKEPIGARALNINQVFRKQHGRYLQEEAMGLVQKGETSVQEVLRVLRGDGAKPAAPTAPAGTVSRSASR